MLIFLFLALCCLFTNCSVDRCRDVGSDTTATHTDEFRIDSNLMIVADSLFPRTNQNIVVLFDTLTYNLWYSVDEDSIQLLGRYFNSGGLAPEVALIDYGKNVGVGATVISTILSSDSIFWDINLFVLNSNGIMVDVLSNLSPIGIHHYDAPFKDSIFYNYSFNSNYQKTTFNLVEYKYKSGNSYSQKTITTYKWDSTLDQFKHEFTEVISTPR